MAYGEPIRPPRAHHHGCIPEPEPEFLKDTLFPGELQKVLERAKKNSRPIALLVFGNGESSSTRYQKLFKAHVQRDTERFRDWFMFDIHLEGQDRLPVDAAWLARERPVVLVRNEKVAPGWTVAEFRFDKIEQLMM